MIFLRIILLSLLVLSTYSQPLLDWLRNGQHPPNLKKALSLKDHVINLLESTNLSGRHFVVILPEDKAWRSEGSTDLYSAIKADPELAQSLLFDAVAEVGIKVKKLKDLEGIDTIETLAGTPVMMENNKLYFATVKSDGTLKKKERINIKSEPVAVLDDATIFVATSIKVPNDIKKPH